MTGVISNRGGVCTPTTHAYNSVCHEVKTEFDDILSMCSFYDFKYEMSFQSKSSPFMCVLVILTFLLYFLLGTLSIGLFFETSFF